MKNFKYLLFPIILLSSVSASHRDKQLSLSINTNYRAFSDDTEPSSSEGSKEEQEVELKVNSSNFSTVTNRSKSSSYTDFLSEQKSEEEQGIELIELKVKESSESTPIVTLAQSEETCCEDCCHTIGCHHARYNCNRFKKCCKKASLGVLCCPFLCPLLCLFGSTDVCEDISRMGGCDSDRQIWKSQICRNCIKCTAGVVTVGGLTYASTLCCGFNGTIVQTVFQSIGTTLTCLCTSRKSCLVCCRDIWISTTRDCCIDCCNDFCGDGDCSGPVDIEGDERTKEVNCWHCLCC